MTLLASTTAAALAEQARQDAELATLRANVQTAQRARADAHNRGECSCHPKETR